MLEKLRHWNFRFHDPPPSLADSVKAIWCARGTKQEFDAPEPIVPDGCVEIIFNLGDRFINAETGALQPRDLLAGQMTRPVIALPTGEVDLIGVRFKTGRAGAALRIPMWELQDQLIAASDVVHGLDRVADDLRNLPQPERLEHLGRTLVAAPRRRSTRDAMQRGRRGAGDDRRRSRLDRDRNASRRASASRAGISNGSFGNSSACGAKHVARIARIHSALDLLQQQPSLSGAEIAAACGYSDQAHLIRECQEMAGRTPQRLKTTERSLAGLMREAV